MLSIGYNKKGLYAATLTIVVIIVGVISYNIYLINKDKSVALENVGERASSSLNSFYEAEKIKYYIDEAAKYAAFNAIFLMGENGGIYDKAKCVQNNYVVLSGNCKLNVEEDFKKYFNDKFNEYLNEYNIKAEDFELNLNEELKGFSMKNLELGVGETSSSNIEFNVKVVDDETTNLVLERINKNDYMDIINKYSIDYDVPESLIIAVIAQESGGNINAVSEVGAAGLMQLMPETAKSLGLKNTIYKCDRVGNYSSCDCIAAKKDTCDYKNDERFNAERNLYAGVNYLRNLLNTYKDVNLALAAYNWGPDRVNRNCNLDEGFSSCKNVPTETKNYIEKILNWMGLSGEEVSEKMDFKKIGTYYFKPEFLVDLNYNLDNFNQAKEVAENWINGNCDNDQENCALIGYSLERKIPKDLNLMVFEFKSKEKLYGIKEVSIKFALPIKT